MIRKYKYGNEYLNYIHYLTQIYFVYAFAVCDAESNKIASKIHGKIHEVYAFAVGDAEFNKTANNDRTGRNNAFIQRFQHGRC